MSDSPDATYGHPQKDVCVLLVSLAERSTGRTKMAWDFLFEQYNSKASGAAYGDRIAKTARDKDHTQALNVLDEYERALKPSVTSKVIQWVCTGIMACLAIVLTVASSLLSMLWGWITGWLKRLTTPDQQKKKGRRSQSEDQGKQIDCCEEIEQRVENHTRATVKKALRFTLKAGILATRAMMYRLPVLSRDVSTLKSTMNSLASIDVRAFSQPLPSSRHSTSSQGEQHADAGGEGYRTLLPPGEQTIDNAIQARVEKMEEHMRQQDVVLVTIQGSAAHQRTLIDELTDRIKQQKTQNQAIMNRLSKLELESTQAARDNRALNSSVQTCHDELQAVNDIQFYHSIIIVSLLVVVCSVVLPLVMVMFINAMMDVSQFILPFFPAWFQNFARMGARWALSSFTQLDEVWNIITSAASAAFGTLTYS